MNSLEPLMALLAQTERERDEALAAQARTEKQYLAAVTQSEQLLDYRKEYEQRWAAHFKQNCSIEVVRCYQAFTERLAQAVSHQQRAEEHMEQQRESARVLVMSYEMRVASVQKLIERRLNEARLLADRREQKLTDEFAARTQWKPHASTPNTIY